MNTPGPVTCCSAPARDAPRQPPPPPASAGGARPGRLVTLPGGRFRRGTDTPLVPHDGEGPARPVTIEPFAIDPHAVTNDSFAAFIAATGTTTEAERHGWSLVFRGFVPRETPGRLSPDGPHWWCRVEGATWREPEGPGSTLQGRGDHPVVHVSWNDARSYAAWAGGRLPTEAEWEYAAAGGQSGLIYPWGDRAPNDDTFLPCNIWQGSFPDRNTAADGFPATAPVSAFAPNRFGLYNMAGNVWEWCADPFRVRSVSRSARMRNAAGLAQGEKVMKGGSYLCHPSYCHRYRIAARTGVGADTSVGHAGFRVVYDLGGRGGEQAVLY